MAVQRDRITVFPPDGETVVVDLLDGGVSLGTAHAERTTTRTLTLPLTISERTSFFVPASSGPYDVSVKLDGEEIAGPAGTPVTVSDFPAEVRTRINAAELGSVAGSGGSIPLSDLSNAGYTDPGDNQGSLVVAPSSGSGKKAGLTDVQGINGSGNGVFWKTQGVDGDQVLEVYTGDNGVHVLRFTAAGILSVDDVDVLDVSDGVLRFPALPTADPTVAGALWNDAGTVKISAG